MRGSASPRDVRARHGRGPGPGAGQRLAAVLEGRRSRVQLLLAGETVSHISRELGLPAGLIGLVFGIGATGALLGAVVAPKLSARYGVGRMAVTGAVLFPSGVFGTINDGARPLGAMIGGLLGGSLGLRPTLLIAAAGGILSCLWLLGSPIPRLRSLAPA